MGRIQHPQSLSSLTRPAIPGECMAHREILRARCTAVSAPGRALPGRRPPDSVNDNLRNTRGLFEPASLSIARAISPGPLVDEHYEKPMRPLRRVSAPPADGAGFDNPFRAPVIASLIFHDNSPHANGCISHCSPEPRAFDAGESKDAPVLTRKPPQTPADFADSGFSQALPERRDSASLLECLAGRGAGWSASGAQNLHDARSGATYSAADLAAEAPGKDAPSSYPMADPAMMSEAFAMRE